MTVTQAATTPSGPAQAGGARAGVARTGFTRAGVARAGVAQAGFTQAGFTQAGVAGGVARTGVARIGFVQAGTMHSVAAPVDMAAQFAAATMPARTPTGARADAWLVAFERARWEAQPRYHAVRLDAGAARAANADTLTALAVSAGPVRGSALPLAPSAGSPGPHELDAAASGARSNTRNATTHGLRAQGHEPPGVETLRLPVPPAHDPPAGRERAGACPQALHAKGGTAACTAVLAQGAGALVRNALPRAAARAADAWPARSVHVHVGEQEAAVWVRDARLSPAQAVRLLERLRPVASGVAGALRSVRLTVNGQPVHVPR